MKNFTCILQEINIIEWGLSNYSPVTSIIKTTTDSYDTLQSEVDVCGSDSKLIHRNILCFVQTSWYNEVVLIILATGIKVVLRQDGATHPAAQMNQDCLGENWRFEDQGHL